MNDGNPYAALAGVMAQPKAAGALFRTCTVLTVTPTGDDPATGTLLTATAGELPMDAEDIVFLRHTAGDVSIGETLMLLPDADGQQFYCIGRF